MLVALALLVTVALLSLPALSLCYLLSQVLPRT